MRITLPNVTQIGDWIGISATSVGIRINSTLNYTEIRRKAIILNQSIVSKSEKEEKIQRDLERNTEGKHRLLDKKWL